MNATEDRLLALEHEVRLLRSRLARLDGVGKPLVPARAPSSAAASSQTSASLSAGEARLRRRIAPVAGEDPPQELLRPAAEPDPGRPVDWEEVLGRRLLALVGGVAVFVGAAFFVALAIQHAWIGESARIALAFAGSSALLTAGTWLYERRGHTQAALAMVGTAVASLYLTLAVATSVYELIPEWLALPAALAVGAAATALAVRWSSRTVAGLGIGGALLAPALADLSRTPTVLFLALAFACASAVLVWRRWPWLAVGAFLLTASQVAVWIHARPPDAQVVALLSVFAALNLVGVLGHEVRTRSGRLRASTSLLASAGALTFGGLGYLALPHGAAGIWLASLAAAHASAGAYALASRRVHDDIALVVLGVSLTLANVAFGVLASGPVLAIGWAVSAAVLADVVRRLTGRAELVELTVGAQLALASAHTLLFDAPPRAVADGTVDLSTAVPAAAAILVAACVSAREVGRERRVQRIVLDGLSLAALAYIDVAVLDGAALVVALGLESIALAELARRLGDEVARVGSLGFLALAGAHAVLFEAPPAALVHGADSFRAAAIALGIVTVAAVRCQVPAAALASGLYLASVLLVTVVGPGQQAQVVLSGFWTLCGLAGLWLGLRRGDVSLRFAGFGLLGLAVAKVFVYDLAALASGYRVLSFVALGLLLLAAAFAYQRLSPREAPS